jgi:hypothetical protein
VDDTINWLFLGDFNFYRSLENRNKLGGNIIDTLHFNDAIGHLGLIELTLKDKKFTWSNMQMDPLLEQLDWFFTSPNWTIDFPNTEVLPLAKITSDYIPCKISISTRIPKANIFRFENFWAEHEDFVDTVCRSWTSNKKEDTTVKQISKNLKILRRDLKDWSKNLSKLGQLIRNCNTFIGFLDNLEDVRRLFYPEINLRCLIKRKLQKLLHHKNIYWKNRYKTSKVRFGDECTKFFHAMATISHSKNAIPQILNDEGAWIQDHEGKACLLWNALKNRMGVSNGITMHFDLESLITPRDDLEDMVDPFQVEEIDNIIKRMPPDKTPGPDGFNGLFLKKCWKIIKGDFFALCDEFYSSCANLEGLNTSYITLIPKTNSPETVSDYRPISLMNISPKIFSKILVERLQRKIISLVHRN